MKAMSLKWKKLKIKKTRKKAETQSIDPMSFINFEIDWIINSCYRHHFIGERII